MPSQINNLIVRELDTAFSGAEGMIFVSLSGLTVSESEGLRNSLAEHDIRLLMVRNRLAKLAIEIGPLSMSFRNAQVVPTMCAFPLPGISRRDRHSPNRVLETRSSGRETEPCRRGLDPSRSLPTSRLGENARYSGNFQIGIRW